jgi:hypothetical protein
MEVEGAGGREKTFFSREKKVVPAFPRTLILLSKKSGVLWRRG